MDSRLILQAAASIWELKNEKKELLVDRERSVPRNPRIVLEPAIMERDYYIEDALQPLWPLGYPSRDPRSVLWMKYLNSILR